MRSLIVQTRFLCRKSLLLAMAPLPLIANLSMSAGQDARSERPAEPFVAVAIAGVDRALHDIDALFRAAEQPEFAQFVSGVVSGLNDLRGIDRQRPMGVLGFLPPGPQQDMQAVVFAPVTQMDQLLETVKRVGFLRLEPVAATGGYALHTRKDEWPVSIRKGMVFVDVTRRENATEALDVPIADPTPLLNNVLRTQDAVVLFRREGVPGQVVQRMLRDLEKSEDEDRRQQPGESEAEFAVRRHVTGEVLDWARAAVAEWKSAALGVTVADAQGGLQLQADVRFDREGSVARRLSGMVVPATRFAKLRQNPSPLTVAWSLTLPPNVRHIVEMVLSESRDAVDAEWEQMDDESRTTLGGMITALEETVRAGRLDAHLQLRKTSQAKFSLVGGIVINQSELVSQGLVQLLPLASRSEGFREVDMHIGREAGIEIHRLKPARLRRDDRRLYGDEASIYLAAGQGVFWIAVGEKEALPTLQSAIRETASQGETIHTRPPSPGDDIQNAGSPQHPSRPLLEITMHAIPWFDLASAQTLKRSSTFHRLARDAFDDPHSDRAHLRVHVTEDGLSLRAEAGEGYFRLLGRALVERVQHRGPMP